MTEAASGAVSMPPVEPTGNATEKSWQDDLSDELKAHPSLEKFKDSSAADVFKSYINVEKLVGKDKMIFPETDEQFGELFDKLGRPTTSADYDLKKPELPEGMGSDEKLMEQFRDLGHKLGMSQKQISEMHDWYWNQSVEGFNTAMLKVDALKSETEAKLKDDWGEAYDKHINVANRAAQDLGGDPFIDMLSTTGLGRHPEMVKFLAKVGEKTFEDSHLIGDGAGTSTNAEIDQQISEIMNSDRYRSTDTVIRTAAVNEVNRLFKRKFGEKGVVG